MIRTVSSRLVADVQGSADLVLGVAVAQGPEVVDSLVVTVDGQPVPVREVLAPHGTRWHRLAVADARVEVVYEAVARGQAPPQQADEVDLLRYLRPSRYCEADALATATHETFATTFGETRGRAALEAVTTWVSEEITYLAGASAPTDGAVATLAARAGVCRDFAHVVVALLRALDVPARVVSVYAPGLSPMDFHAVAEAWVDDAWRVVDATRMAPRASLLRIATGVDATETAFLTSFGGDVALREIEVLAVVDELPWDDPRTVMTLG